MFLYGSDIKIALVVTKRLKFEATASTLSGRDL